LTSYIDSAKPSVPQPLIKTPSIARWKGNDHGQEGIQERPDERAVGGADRSAEPPDQALLQVAEVPDARRADLAEGPAARRRAAQADEHVPQELLPGSVTHSSPPGD